jgi:hypothetical protein
VCSCVIQHYKYPWGSNSLAIVTSSNRNILRILNTYCALKIWDTRNNNARYAVNFGSVKKIVQKRNLKICTSIAHIQAKRKHWHCSLWDQRWKQIPPNPYWQTSGGKKLSLPNWIGNRTTASLEKSKLLVQYLNFRLQTQYNKQS